MRDGLARKQADARIVTALDKVVADLQLVLTSAELARGLDREVVGEEEKDLGAESLEERAPGFAGY